MIRRPGQAALEATAHAVQAHITRLIPAHSLPGKPIEHTLWWEMKWAIKKAYLEVAERYGVRGGKAVIMAGAPGAGKSRALDTARGVLGPDESARLGLDEAGFTTIDPDDIKQLLLGNPVPHLRVDDTLLTQARHHWDRLITREAPQPLPDGTPLLRGELATLVHRFSTDIAEETRQQLLSNRYNVKIEGTLQWEGQGPKLATELDNAEYSQVAICVVDAPEGLCQQGALQRWAIPRARNDPTARYTPPEAITSNFDRHGNRSIRNAEYTQAILHALNLPAHRVIINRSSHTLTHIDEKGTNRTYHPSSLPATVIASRPPQQNSKPNTNPTPKPHPTGHHRNRPQKPTR